MAWFQRTVLAALRRHPMDRTEARRKWGEAYGEWYWAKREKSPQKEIVAYILEYRKWRAIWKTAPPETNGRGNVIWRDFDADRQLGTRRGDDRYHYDFGVLTSDKGWRQFDTKQDASYFGVWVNITQRMTFTYCEGDRTLVICPDDAHLKAELDSMVACYGEAPPAWVVFSQEENGNWTRTDIYDPRPTLE